MLTPYFGANMTYTCLGDTLSICLYLFGTLFGFNKS